MCPLPGTGGLVKIEVLYFEGCPGYERVLPSLRAIADDLGVQAEIELQPVETPADAERLRFLGSPTVRVDGEDVEPGAAGRSDFGLKCRLYRSASGTAGQPSADLLRAALAGARPRPTLP